MSYGQKLFSIWGIEYLSIWYVEKISIWNIDKIYFSIPIIDKNSLSIPHVEIFLLAYRKKLLYIWCIDKFSTCGIHKLFLSILGMNKLYKFDTDNYFVFIMYRQYVYVW